VESVYKINCELLTKLDMWTWSKYCGKYCIHRRWSL